MNRIRRWLMSSKKYADYMRQFHKRNDGIETNLNKLAQSLWYAKLASNYTMPIDHIGYCEDSDYLDVWIDGVQYNVILKKSVIDG